MPREKVKRIGLPYSVQAWNGDLGAWVERARFYREFDAKIFARGCDDRPRRVCQGRSILAAYSGEYIPPSARDSVAASGRVTEAPEQ